MECGSEVPQLSLSEKSFAVRTSAEVPKQMVNCSGRGKKGGKKSLCGSRNLLFVVAAEFCLCG